MMRISIQLPGNAHKRLQQVAGVDGGSVQLRTIAVQQTTVLLDEEVDQPPGGKALWTNLPTAGLHTGIVYLYLLAKAGGASAAPQQLHLFASLPILALPTAIGSELEDLFGNMIQEMSSREEAGEPSSTCGSERGSEGGGNTESDGGSCADSGKKGRLQRWRDRMQGWSMRSEQLPRGSVSSDNSGTSAGGMGGRPSTTEAFYSPASSFSSPPHSQLPSPPSSQVPLPSPPRGFRLNVEPALSRAIGSSTPDLGPHPEFPDNDQQTNVSSGHLLQSPLTSAGIPSKAGTFQQIVQNLPPLPSWQEHQQPGQQQKRKQLAPAGPKVPGNLVGSAPTSAPRSPTLPVPPHLPGGLQAVLPDNVAETLSTQLASMVLLNIPPTSQTLFSTPLVAATFSTHFGPLSADLGYVLETAERCVDFRSQSTGAQTSPAGIQFLNAMGVNVPLHARIIEDMSHLFSDQGCSLCLDLLCQAAEKLEGAAS
ncbi:hypothetical protein DUNSADRAFT_12899 [Dunaliella salina]|uniref:Ubiquitin-like domain-containing protein n=1 Tax=Dunaliella salina TaxID=3046 RepID=A0ABQ7H3P5_DUNSA|nr:hypothetical protein DUNSADRAFT_12899 [Dunaliella salina]KAF5841455.1 hypothetical protein DUNSADRAFT_12899 [Dunaliella salina]|eukprot:KAF5841453.1 hypothetical protein DUNSADRAFT_12899 [Dunaliella salina]